ncbi:cobalamin biosynthesis protein [Brevibacillus laterosporus]|uniref:cobalt-precorrin 5A hydrolase n=1 Tax=Brevibacillus laterosporus TaxID=1465 RepID=UPI0018CCF92F|nr:cobalamin biosynthesis protein [Brevibacillus laterosporus]MBG9796295.1 cobalamin biosynthesis protein CbiG [Brevibacillus laterosporus]MCR8937297.1 cobalamin biosynthesis protein [Brevibacillus laterosporus]MCZ0839936.1 cobalamin biosynthesis protein [Brevibacillus laterosporus]MCZ0843494.1 cobalamin biosynthesis protein [Brevibacillus laterosporus]MED1910144.1 cobalamin biosynthesis protein [Brevibacillus laterosporus]
MSEGTGVGVGRQAGAEGNTVTAGRTPSEIVQNPEQLPYAIVAITKHGVEKARHLHQVLPGSHLYYMEKFLVGDEQERDIRMFTGSVRLLFADFFKKYNGLIFFISLGAVVRMMAPVLQDKKVDPGVVVVDDRGENVISVLSGHLGGANELTRELARLLDANPVITTASDVQKTIPVDLFGRGFGWELDSFDKVTPVSASVVNEEKVAIIQEAGESGWWPYPDKPLPGHFQVYHSMAEAWNDTFKAALVITPRLLTVEEQARFLENGVVYRPKTIVLGVGCNRGTSAEEIEQVILQILEQQGLSVKSVRNIATITLKQDEAGLLAVCQKYGWKLIAYTPEQLNEMPMTERSETVYKFTGAYGVSEPAALRCAKAETPFLAKQKNGNVTLSIALVNGGGILHGE